MITKHRVPIICALAFFFCFLFSYQRLSQTAIDDHRLGSAWSPRIEISEQDFVTEASNSSIGDDCEFHYIKALCDEQSWDSKVVFNCEGILGGIGNVRQQILHCMRYAIDAGAALIEPAINLRAPDNLSNLKSGTMEPMEYLFDRDRFLSRLKATCPKMRVYQDIEEVKREGAVMETGILSVRDMHHFPDYRVYSVRNEVNRLITEAGVPPGHTSIIPFKQIMQYYPICHDNIGLANTFSNLVPLREDVHHLVSQILYNLYSRYELSIDPSAKTTEMAAQSFLGIHLRTEADSLPHWVNFKDQAKYYISRIKSSTYLNSLSIIYVASGDVNSIHDFSIKAKALSSAKHIVTKYDCLSGEHLEKLNSLTWDQQALVDLLVLERSGYFMGMAESSFAWMITIARRIKSEAGSCGMRLGFWKGKLHGASFRDEFSDLIGFQQFGWESDMWP